MAPIEKGDAMEEPACIETEHPAQAALVPESAGAQVGATVSAACADDPSTGEAQEAGRDSRHNKDLGERGEEAACAFLIRRGFDIVERNWVCAAGEADIIAIENETLHFIEVKTRMSEARGFPAEAVDVAKRDRYERIAELYLRSLEGGDDICVTFDVISILVTGEHRAFLRFHRNVLSGDCGDCS